MSYHFPALLLSTVLLFMLPAQIVAQSCHDNCEVHGTITDQSTREPLAGATVEIPELAYGTATDDSGSFMFTDLPDGSYTVIARFIGFTANEQSITLPDQDGKHIEMNLQPSVLAAPDVVVTASPLGRVTNYQPTMAYDAEDLQRRAGPSFGHMLDGEPGLSMRSFGPAPARPVIRGYDGERVLILENGERMGDISETAHDHSIALDPLAAERVEVVRGPASLLYGSNALGGVVNLITTDIPYEWSPGHAGSASLEGASMNQSLTGFGRYVYGTESHAVTARLSHRNAGDLSTPEGTLPGTSISNLEGSVGTALSGESLSGGLAGQFLYNVFGLPEGLDDPDERVEIRVDRQAFQSRLEWSANGFIENISLRLHASRLFQQEVQIEHENGSIEEDIGLEFLQHSFSSTLSLQHAAITLSDAGVIGLNLIGRNLVVGGEEAFTPGSQEGSIGIFTYQEKDINEITSLQFGLRGETHIMQTITNEFFPDISAERSTFTWAGSLGLNIRPLRGIELGAQLARAHRFPALEELYADGPHFGIAAFEIGDPTLNDEIGLGADVFARYRSSRVYTEISGFYNHLSNYIIFQSTGETDTASDFPIYMYESDDVEKWGAEATGSVLISDALKMGATADFVHANRLDAADTPLPTIPPSRTRIETTFDPGNWWIGANTRFVAAQNRVAPEEQPTDGYTLLNLEGGVRLNGPGRHVISLRVDNVTNVTYRDHLSRVNERNFPMPGRNIQLTYRWIF